MLLSMLVLFLLAGCGGVNPQPSGPTPSDLAPATQSPVPTPTPARTPTPTLSLAQLQADVDEFIPDQVQQVISQHQDSTLEELVDALQTVGAELSRAMTVPGALQVYPVASSQEVGVSALVVKWRTASDPRSSLSAIVWDEGEGWQAQLLAPTTLGEPVSGEVRMEKIGEEFLLANFSNPCASSPVRFCELLDLYTLQEDAWRHTWPSGEAPGWGWPQNRARFAGQGIDTVLVESSSWQREDPKNAVFAEAHIGPQRWFEDTWQREGQMYVLDESRVRPSAYNTLVEFLYALHQDQDPSPWVANPGVLEDAERLNLGALPEGLVASCAICEQTEFHQDGPIQVAVGDAILTFRFAEPAAQDGNYLVEAIESD